MKPTRRFEKVTYNRALNAPKIAKRKLQEFAHLARKNGWNARVIENANSSSLFVRRRYNRPIPETDPSRTEVFPVALAAVLKNNKDLSKAFPQEFVSMTNKRVMELAPTLDERQKTIAREQIKEIKEFTEQIDLHSEELAELGRQSMQNMNMQGFELGKSNLTEEQWAEIYNYEYQDGVSVISRLQGQVRNKAFRSVKSFIESSDHPQLLEYRSITDEELIAEINSPSTIISQIYSEWLDSIDQAVQESLVLYLRSNDMSEHSLLASIKYPLMSDSPLIYTEWESYINPSSAIEEPKIRVEPLGKVDQVMITFPGIGGATVEAKIDRKITDSWLNAMRDGSMDVISLESIKKAYERRLSDFTRIWSGDPFKGWNTQGKSGRLRGRKAEYVVDKPSNIEPTNIPPWVKPGDIVVGRIGGKVSVYDPQTANELPRNAIFIGLKPGEETNYDLGALKYELENRIGVGKDIPLRASVKPSLRVSEIKALDLNTPPIDQQTRWAQVLDNNNRVIELTEEELAKRRNMQDGLRIDPRVRPDFRKFSEVRE